MSMPDRESEGQAQVAAHKHTHQMGVQITHYGSVQLHCTDTTAQDQ